MVTFCLGALCGVAVGRARGGRLAGLTTLRFRAPILLVVAALAHSCVAIVAPDYRMAALGSAYTIVGIWLLRNAFHHRGGLRLGFVALGVGWLLNIIPVMLNGGMPVSADGLERVGAPRTMPVTEGHFSKHVPADRDTRASVLGDVIPLRMVATVISVGDIVVLAGIALVVASGMTTVAEVPSRRVVAPDAAKMGR